MPSLGTVRRSRYLQYLDAFALNDPLVVDVWSRLANAARDVGLGDLNVDQALFYCFCIGRLYGSFRAGSGA